MNLLPRIQSSNLLPWRRQDNNNVNQISSPFFSLQNEINRLFNGFGNELMAPSILLENQGAFPAVAILENDQSFKVEVELPGIKESNVEVDINDNYLTVKGEKKRSSSDEGQNYICNECYYGEFQRTVALPDDADAGKAKASFKEGVLWVEIPKKAGAATKTRKLEIRKAA